ncbi:HlyD family efflux transporter periplasmic adaptor subunit [Roseateles sp. DAIF2]|uniref:HlyD family efflux transporter periplasmic adaptor subunit n=1 Tax=Roseateles sp. DAIF2 TaxID=2714952 RepID=UPI0018A31179|nr:HlyD family efflux transporter periplasmic adaptor subunit [Roseateles sp. DAIF2]QPF74850.1 HlyD family efflux transporter periplasmic adaptor subunit [Roseateles sp. DAIF2]
MLSAATPLPATLWQALLDADPLRDGAAFHGAWLQAMVQGLAAGGASVAEAVLVLDGRHLGPQGQPGELRPAAAWPLQQPCSPALATLCEEALAQRGPLQRALAGGSALLALPLLQHQQLQGVVGVQFLGAQVPRQALDWLRWGLGWLLGGNGRGEEDALRERMLLALELMTAVIAEPDWRAACNLAVTETAHRLGCDRVSLGLAKGGRLRLQALSNAADFSARLDLAQALEAAMDEASDQGLALAVQDGAPAPGQDGGAVLREQLALTRGFGTGSALSVPFMLDERRHGVMLFEWPAGAAMPALAQQMALGLPPLLGRLLLDKRHAQRAWPLRLRDALAEQAAKLFGPRHALRKLLLLGLAGLAACLATATGPYRIAANAALEGGVRRVVAAPFDGFVASSLVRAGQVVRQGELLATLDDRDLRLESEKWASQQTQYAKQAQEAQAQHSLAQIQISLAQIRQAASQRRLSEAMLARSAIRAPLDGLVVSGDLSQSLGAALKKGQTLFEISPLDSYRLILQVDETDIDAIAIGQRGQLMLTALPGESFAFTVRLLTPVAQARDGRNQFRVEAQLEPSAARQALLRPGMEGIAKVEMGERRLVWIWTHRMGDWLRLQAWQWLGL